LDPSQIDRRLTDGLAVVLLQTSKRPSLIRGGRLQRDRRRHRRGGGDPRSAAFIEALQDGRLLFSAEQKSVF